MEWIWNIGFSALPLENRLYMAAPADVYEHSSPSPAGLIQSLAILVSLFHLSFQLLIVPLFMIELTLFSLTASAQSHGFSVNKLGSHWATS
jgi:hypothetical protein